MTVLSSQGKITDGATKRLHNILPKRLTPSSKKASSDFKRAVSEIDIELELT